MEEYIQQTPNSYQSKHAFLVWHDQSSGNLDTLSSEERSKTIDYTVLALNDTLISDIILMPAYEAHECIILYTTCHLNLYFYIVISLFYFARYEGIITSR